MISRPLFAAILFTSLAFISESKAISCYALSYDSVTGNHLLAFDSATPGAVKDTVISGLSGISLVGMHMRTTVQPGASNPGVGSLWALGYIGGHYQLYVISTSGEATQIGGDLTALDAAVVSDDAWGFAFDPARDRFAAVGTNYNFEINPNTATAVRKTDVFTDFSANPAFSGAAFSSASFGGSSRYYIIDTGDHTLAVSNSIQSGGRIANIGATNTLAMVGQPNALDIHLDLTLLAAEDGKLYRLNRSVGTSTEVGSFPMGSKIRGLVIVPPAPLPALPPTVKIKGPAKVTTTQASLRIKGTASSETGIARVQYRIGKKGAYKNAQGTTNWKFTAKLKPGVNVISVHATGGTGVVSANKVIKVFRK